MTLFDRIYGSRTGKPNEFFVFGSGGAVLTVVWGGDDLKGATADAAVAGIDETMADCVASAMGLVRVDTGALRDTIQIQEPATSAGNLVRGVWGSYSDYAIYQEIGPIWTKHPWAFTPYLRPSADRHYPELPARVASHMGMAA